MAEYLIQSETLDDIADAINAKTGGSSAMTPAEMVTAIGTISGGGGGGLPLLLEDTITVTDDTRENSNYTITSFIDEFVTNADNVQSGTCAAVCFYIENTSTANSRGVYASAIARYGSNFNARGYGFRFDGNITAGNYTTFRIGSGSVIHKYVYQLSGVS